MVIFWIYQVRDVIKFNFIYFLVLFMVAARKLKFSHVALFIALEYAALEQACPT